MKKDNNRTNDIMLRLSDSEMLEVVQKSHELNISKAVYARTLALGQSLPTPFADVKLLAEINRIGNNLNQVAKALNAGSNINKRMSVHLAKAIQMTVEIRDALIFDESEEAI